MAVPCVGLTSLLDEASVLEAPEGLSTYGSDKHSSRRQLSFWYAAYIMRLHQSLFLLVAVACSLFAQDLKPVADRLAAQNNLFEEQYETDLRNFPERATAYGDYRYNDKLAEYSLNAISQRHKTDETFLARLSSFQRIRAKLVTLGWVNTFPFVSESVG